MRGLPLQGNYTGAETGQILGEIWATDAQRHRDWRVKATWERFFAWAQDLGLLTDDSLGARQRFWDDIRMAVYAAWRNQPGLTSEVSNTVDHDAAVDTDNERIIVTNRTSGTDAHVGRAGLLKDQDIDQAWDKQAKAAFVSHSIHWPLAGYSPRCPPNRLLVSDV